MKLRLATTLAAVSLLAIAGCDSRDYEAEIATLQSDLQNAKSQNEQMQTELEQLRAQAEAQPAISEEARTNAQSELNTVLQTAATTFKSAGTMTEEQNAPAEQRNQELGTLRDGIQKIVQSVQAAAEDLGIQLETVAMDTDSGATEGTPAPAAGPEGQQQGAGPEGQQQEPAAQPQQGTPPAEQQKPGTAQ